MNSFFMATLERVETMAAPAMMTVETSITPVQAQHVGGSEEEESLYDWQVRQIKEGLAQADRGEFVPKEEMDAFFAKWK